MLERKRTATQSVCCDVRALWILNETQLTPDSQVKITSVSEMKKTQSFPQFGLNLLRVSS